MFGELTTSGGETWLSTAGFVAHLGSSELPIESGWRAFDASVWLGPDALWLTTHNQARRYLLP